MNQSSGVALLAVGLAAGVGMSFGYREFRKAEAHSACDSAASQITEIQKLSQAEQMKRFAEYAETALGHCLAKLEAIPFPSAEQKSAATDLRKAQAFIPMIKGVAGFAAAFTSDEPSTISTAPTKLTQQNFDGLPLGATLPQVEGVLGKGKLSSQTESQDYKHESWSWNDRGASITLGFTNGKLANKNASDLKPAPVSASPTAQTVSAVTPAPVSPSATSQPIAFDNLPPCDQLDAVAKSGKSVAEFVKADWVKYGGVGSVCSWHQPQIEVARRVLFPPAPTRTTTARRSTSSGSSTVVIQQAAPVPRWNNCNGVQEPGESYSARCHGAQELNDLGLGNGRTHRIDKRPPMIDPGFSGHPNGAREGEPNGYSGSN